MVHFTVADLLALIRYKKKKKQTSTMDMMYSKFMVNSKL